MTAGIKTLEILDRPGVYEYLDKITGRLINGILDAGRAAGHSVCGGHINGERLSASFLHLNHHLPANKPNHGAIRCDFQAILSFAGYQRLSPKPNMGGGLLEIICAKDEVSLHQNGAGVLQACLASFLLKAR